MEDLMKYYLVMEETTTYVCIVEGETRQDAENALDKMQSLEIAAQNILWGEPQEYEQNFSIQDGTGNLVPE